jgi:hypothetical protein
VNAPETIPEVYNQSQQIIASTLLIWPALTLRFVRKKSGLNSCECRGWFAARVESPPGLACLTAEDLPAARADPTGSTEATPVTADQCGSRLGFRVLLLPGFAVHLVIAVKYQERSNSVPELVRKAKLATDGSGGLIR